MKIFDIIAFTMGNLFRRKLRALLTISGVVVGTCMIVLMFSLGYGMEAALKQSLSQMGDLTQIQVYNYNNGANGNDLVLDDAAIAQIAAIPNVQAVSPFWRLESVNMQLFIGKKDRYRMDASNIIGVYP
ncbi:MAG: ABC transporter permease, partial [Oscillospiraceae bacterium]